MTFFESIVIILLLSILTALCMFLLGVNNEMSKLGKTEEQLGLQTIGLTFIFIAISTFNFLLILGIYYLGRYILGTV